MRSELEFRNLAAALTVAKAVAADVDAVVVGTDGFSLPEKNFETPSAATAAVGESPNGLFPGPKALATDDDVMVMVVLSLLPRPSFWRETGLLFFGSDIYHHGRIQHIPPIK